MHDLTTEALRHGGSTPAFMCTYFCWVPLSVLDLSFIRGQLLIFSVSPCLRGEKPPHSPSQYPHSPHKTPAPLIPVSNPCNILYTIETKAHEHKRKETLI